MFKGFQDLISVKGFALLLMKNIFLINSSEWKKKW